MKRTGLRVPLMESGPVLDPRWCQPSLSFTMAGLKWLPAKESFFASELEEVKRSATVLHCSIPGEGARKPWILAVGEVCVQVFIAHTSWKAMLKSGRCCLTVAQHKRIRPLPRISRCWAKAKAKARKAKVTRRANAKARKAKTAKTRRTKTKTRKAKARPMTKRPSTFLDIVLSARPGGMR